MLYGSSMIQGENTLALVYGFRATNGRIALPVAPSQYIYSQFEHVAGVPAPEGTQGISIDKLKVLDVLIDQLTQLKRKPEVTLGAGGIITDQRIDALIDQYEKQIRGAIAVRVPYAPAPTAPSAALFDLVA